MIIGFLRNAFLGGHSEIPPTAVGGLFRSYLQTTCSPTAARASAPEDRETAFARKDLNHPPTAEALVKSRTPPASAAWTFNFSLVNAW